MTETNSACSAYSAVGISSWGTYKNNKMKKIVYIPIYAEYALFIITGEFGSYARSKIGFISGEI